MKWNFFPEKANINIEKEKTLNMRDEKTFVEIKNHPNGLNVFKTLENIE